MQRKTRFAPRLRALAWASLAFASGAQAFMDPMSMMNPMSMGGMGMMNPMSMGGMGGMGMGMMMPMMGMGAMSAPMGMGSNMMSMQHRGFSTNPYLGGPFSGFGGNSFGGGGYGGSFGNSGYSGYSGGFAGGNAYNPLSMIPGQPVAAQRAPLAGAGINPYLMAPPPKPAQPGVAIPGLAGNPYASFLLSAPPAAAKAVPQGTPQANPPPAVPQNPYAAAIPWMQQPATPVPLTPQAAAPVAAVVTPAPAGTALTQGANASAADFGSLLKVLLPVQTIPAKP